MTALAVPALAVLLALAPAPGAGARAASVQERGADEFAALVADLDPALDEQVAVARLAGRGVALAALVVAWHRPSEEAPEGRETFDEDQWRRLGAALDRLPSGSVVETLALELAGPDPPQVARAALRMLRRSATAQACALLVECVRELAPGRLGVGADGQLALEVFATVQERDPDLSGALAARLADLPSVWVPDLVRGLALGRDAHDLDLLWRALESRTDERALLSALASVAPRYVGRVDDPHLQALRRRLLSDDVWITEGAALALAALQDDDCAEQLVAFLTQSDPRVRGAAHYALRRLTDLPFGPEPGRWERWLAASRAWWDERGRTLADDLRWGSAREATDLVIEVASQRLRRPELVEALVGTFDRDDEEVCDLAILCLRELRWQGTTRRLIELLDEPSARVQGRAWRALRVLTGMDAGPEADDWRRALLIEG